MESQPLFDALRLLVERVVSQSATDEPLRRHLQEFARNLLSATGAGEGAAQPEAPPIVPTVAIRVEPKPPGELMAPRPSPAPTVVAREPAAVRPAAPIGPREPLPELTLGRARPVAPEPPRVTSAVYEEPVAVDFALVESRCRLKAEASRWAAWRVRRRLAPDTPDSETAHREYEDLIADAKQLRSCFLWMCRLADAPGSTDAPLDELAHCYDGLQQAAALFKQIFEEPELHEDEFPDAMQLLAEVQSGLRAAFLNLAADRDDDQSDVFNWLKETTAERQIYVPRFMRANDRADPSQWADRKKRLDALQETVHSASEKVRRRKKLLGKLRHKASQIAVDPLGAAHEWDDLVAIVDELVTNGMKPSNRDLRTVLLPVMRHRLEGMASPRNFELVTREIERYLETSGGEDKEEEDSSPTPIPEVRQAAELLSGRTVVLIGGEKRTGAYEALKSAFHLRDLIWIETREHQSIQGFEAYVARADVAVVLLAIRWSSHSFGEVKAFCDEHEKLLVRLPGGYNPNQVALQILTQVSERLRAG